MGCCKGKIMSIFKMNTTENYGKPLKRLWTSEKVQETIRGQNKIKQSTTK